MLGHAAQASKDANALESVRVRQAGIHGDLVALLVEDLVLHHVVNDFRVLL